MYAIPICSHVLITLYFTFYQNQLRVRKTYYTPKTSYKCHSTYYVFICRFCILVFFSLSFFRFSSNTHNGFYCVLMIVRCDRWTNTIAAAKQEFWLYFTLFFFVSNGKFLFSFKHIYGFKTI